MAPALTLLLTVLLPGLVAATIALGPTPDVPSVGPRATARVRPVPGMLLRGFDPPALPWSAGHRGVDLAAAPGDPVRAALPGRVRFSGTVAGVGWVTVDHGGGLATTYGALRQRPPAGTAVDAGAVIGRLDGAHLDWGARLDGRYIDPLRLLQRWHPTLVPVGEQGLL